MCKQGASIKRKSQDKNVAFLNLAKGKGKCLLFAMGDDISEENKNSRSNNL